MTLCCRPNSICVTEILIGTEHIRYAWKAVGAQPFDIGHSSVDGVDALVAGCMTADSVSYAVEHHEASFGHCGLKPCGFAYYHHRRDQPFFSQMRQQ